MRFSWMNALINVASQQWLEILTSMCWINIAWPMLRLNLQNLAPKRFNFFSFFLNFWCYRQIWVEATNVLKPSQTHLRHSTNCWLCPCKIELLTQCVSHSSASYFNDNQYPDEAKREEIANACNAVIQKPGKTTCFAAGEKKKSSASAALLGIIRKSVCDCSSLLFVTTLLDRILQSIWKVHEASA